MNKKLLTLFLTATIGATTCLAPLSASAEIGNNLNTVNEKIQKLETKKNSIENELSEITGNIAKNEANAVSLMAEMTATQKTLKELKQQIEELNTAIAARKEKLAEQARVVQVNGQTQNYADFLLESESFSDVLGRVDVVSKIVSANQSLVKQQAEDKALVAEKQAENEETLKSQTILAAKLESTKTDLMQQQLEKEAVVATIAAEKSVVENEKQQLLATKTAAEKAAREIGEAKKASVINTSAVAEKATTATTVETQSTPAASTPASSNSWGSAQGAAFGVQGTPYLYGGSTTSGFDCSGFTQYAFSSAGVNLPRTASAQYSASTKVSQSEAKPGDLVFFNQTGSIDHVAIYLGNGKFIGAQSSSGVAVAEINQYYWGKYIVGYGRVN
ncbi:NlpC/P60 family protein [Carnobacterium sp. TMP28]|uniref:C40 family peptidase n=1 Tax=Carnobacterium sp. TMP28 TaxID=3397060 RepID=UPI0039E1E35E